MEANLWLRFFRDAWVEPAPKITNLQHIRDFSVCGRLGFTGKSS
jgi:hypothetical protein